MKKIISIVVIIIIMLQVTVLYSFFANKLSNYPEKIINIIWIGSALLGILFGIIQKFFTFDSRLKIHKSNNSRSNELSLKTSIISNLSIILGIFSTGLYLLMTFITSM